MITLTREKIDRYIEDDLITEKTHPVYEDLAILNYTEKCQFGSKWDEFTLQCRGLIYEKSTMSIIARPFTKFFNYNEHVSKIGPLPDEPFVLHEKVDGSLGILFYYDNRFHIATRGSFVSDQANYANTHLLEKHKDVLDILKLDMYAGYTHLFEIIYPENRIVLNYDFSDLVYLGSVDKNTGTSFDFELSKFGMKTTKTKSLNSMSFDDMTKMNVKNEEGYIVHYRISDVRVKVKFDEYVKLHKVMTGLSIKGIWELLRENGPTLEVSDIIKDVPDELFKWIETELSLLKEQYYSILHTSIEEFDIIEQRCNTRKEFALLIANMTYPNVGFALLDKKETQDLIMKIIKPVQHTLFNNNF